jgi:predicted NBD/HSP70 family sugar kinase
VALFDPTGGIIRRAAVNTDREGGPNNVVGQISALAREVANSKPDVALERMVLAIGAPATVDPSTGVVHAAANLSGWDEVPLRRLLEAEMGCRCLVESDANLAALAEQRQGAGRAVANFAYITVSTGIGAGFILDNHLYRGGEGGAGPAWLGRSDRRRLRRGSHRRPPRGDPGCAMMGASRRCSLAGAGWRACSTNSPSRECLFAVFSPFSSLHRSVDPG